MERLSEGEKERIAELWASQAPAGVIHKEISKSRWAIRRYINRLARRPKPEPKPEPKRSPLRLSLVEREEISRGLAGGESLRSVAWRLGRAPSTISREVRVNGGGRCYRACFAIVLERLRPALKAGYETVYVGANGEVVPVGAPGSVRTGESR